MNKYHLEHLKKAIPELGQLYPDLRLRGGQFAEIVSFPSTPPRFQLAKEFAENKCLMSPLATQRASELRKEYGSWESVPMIRWEEVGKLDSLPAFEPMPEDVTAKLNNASKSAGLATTIYSQGFVDAVNHVLTGAQAQNNFEKDASNYTLLEGSAGSAKSKAIAFAAAVLKRPLYSYDCSNQSSDMIAAALLETTEIAGDPAKTVKNLAYLGVLTSPTARRAYIQAFEQYRGYKGVPELEWSKIAEAEGLKQGVPYRLPGLAFRAKRYGGVLNLEEINTLNAESQTILNSILDVYQDRHPNFYVAASMNPAGKDYSNRSALTPEIRSRLPCQKFVRAQEGQELRDTIYGLLTGKSPLSRVQGQKLRVNAEYYGLKTPEVYAPNVLLGMTDKSTKILVDNLAKFYTTIQGAIANGQLDPRQSSDTDTDELRAITLRNISNLKAHISNGLAATYPRGPINLAENLLESAKPSANSFCTAISDGLLATFKGPLDFTANATELDVGNQTGVGGTVSTLLLLNKMESDCKLGVKDLGLYIETVGSLRERKERLATECKVKKLKWDPTSEGQLDRILESSHRDPVILGTSKFRACGFGRIKETQGSLMTLHASAVEQGLIPAEMNPSKLKELRPAFENFLAEEGFKGAYVVPFTEGKFNNAYLLIPREMLAVPPDTGVNFKVLVLIGDPNAKRGQPLETTDGSNIRMLPETNLLDVRTYLERATLKTGLQQMPLYSVPYHEIDLKPVTNAPTQEV